MDGLVPVERERLVDLVVGGVDATDASEKRAGRIYDEYLPDDELNAGVKSGKYFQGFFNASQYNYLEVGYPLVVHFIANMAGNCTHRESGQARASRRT